MFNCFLAGVLGTVRYWPSHSLGMLTGGSLAMCCTAVWVAAQCLAEKPRVTGRTLVEQWALRVHVGFSGRELGPFLVAFTFLRQGLGLLFFSSTDSHDAVGTIVVVDLDSQSDPSKCHLGRTQQEIRALKVRI